MPRAKRVVVAIGVIALLLIGGLTVWIRATDGAPTTSPSSDVLPPSPITQPTSTPPTPAASAASDGECSSTDITAGVGDASLPADLRWHNGETASWPVSDTAGPTGERDDLPACFASSADGAVLAAVTFLFEQTERSPLQTYPTYVANTAGKEVAIRSLNGHSDGEIQEVMRTSGVETVGYRVDTWTAEQASVIIALRVPGSDAVSGWPVELVRVGGDWLVRLRPDGTLGDPSLLEASDFREWPR